MRCLFTRGMATWGEGIPDFAQEFCIIQGQGSVAGLYPADTQESLLLLWICNPPSEPSGWAAYVAMVYLRQACLPGIT